MSIIRAATSSDSEAILTLLTALHAESVFRSVPIEIPKLKSTVAAFLTQPRHTCIVCEASAGGIDGMIIGYISDYFFSTEAGAWDLALYVRPERRGTRIAYRLWKAFKSWAAANGAKTLWLGTSAGIAPARTRKFYVGLGMEEVGSLYRQSLKSSRP